MQQIEYQLVQNYFKKLKLEFIMKKHDTLIKITLILVLGISLRLLRIFFIDDAPFPDQDRFLEIAKGILSGEIVSSIHTPGYPLIIASVFSVIGESITSVKIFQSLLTK